LGRSCHARVHGVAFLADGIYQVLFSQNLEHFFTLVRKGDLDLYLTKPINSQFMVSCQRVAVANIVNLGLALIYLVWAINHLSHPVGWAQIVVFSVLILSGLVISYALHFMFATFNVIFQDFSAVQFVWYQLYRLATRPDPIYPGFLRMIVMTVFPVAFFASVPARVFVEGFSLTMLMASLGMATGLLVISSRFWKSALRRYASASS
jgi:ABC-2 type transport system permease protein